MTAKQVMKREDGDPMVESASKIFLRLILDVAEKTGQDSARKGKSD